MTFLAPKAMEPGDPIHSSLGLGIQEAVILPLHILPLLPNSATGGKTEMGTRDRSDSREAGGSTSLGT